VLGFTKGRGPFVPSREGCPCGEQPQGEENKKKERPEDDNKTKLPSLAVPYDKNLPRPLKIKARYHVILIMVKIKGFDCALVDTEVGVSITPHLCTGAGLYQGDLGRP